MHVSPPPSNRVISDLEWLLEWVDIHAKTLRTGLSRMLMAGKFGTTDTMMTQAGLWVSYPTISALTMHMRFISLQHEYFGQHHMELYLLTKFGLATPTSRIPVLPDRGNLTIPVDAFSAVHTDLCLKHMP